jgi:hypothetical protein
MLQKVKSTALSDINSIELDIPITDQERVEFKELFDIFDVDEDGEV